MSDASPLAVAMFVVTFICFCALLIDLTRGGRKTFERKPEPEQPSCFGEYAFRHPHITAERDCRNCPFLFDCHESSPFQHA